MRSYISIKPALLTAAMSLGLAFAIPAPGTAADAHSHQHQTIGAPVLHLKLNEGGRWVTDDALRRGMNEIMNLTLAAMPRVHEGAFAAQDYRVLAQGIQTQVDYVVGNCKLPEEADEQLHLVLEQILDGIRLMQGETDHIDGAAKVLHALEAYGKAFDHPGWVGLDL